MERGVVRRRLRSTRVTGDSPFRRRLRRAKPRRPGGVASKPTIVEGVREPTTSSPMRAGPALVRTLSEIDVQGTTGHTPGDPQYPAAPPSGLQSCRSTGGRRRGRHNTGWRPRISLGSTAESSPDEPRLPTARRPGFEAERSRGSSRSLGQVAYPEPQVIPKTRTLPPGRGARLPRRVERASRPSDSLAFRQSPQQAGAHGVCPLDSLGTFHGESVVQAERQGAIESRPRRGVTGIFESVKEPVPADRFAGFLKEGHHDFGRSKCNVRPRNRSADCHKSERPPPLIRSCTPRPGYSTNSRGVALLESSRAVREETMPEVRGECGTSRANQRDWDAC